MYVVEDFLICVDYKEIEYWWIFWIVFWYWYCCGNIVIINIVVDSIVRVIGNI